MYELIILSLLMRWPMHGYLIAKVTNDQIGPWAKLSSGTMYTILARLEAENLIEAVRRAARRLSPAPGESPRAHVYHHRAGPETVSSAHDGHLLQSRRLPARLSV